jgi:3' terminal RNA ribose 2'-O-methyltransferase Hen1
MYLSVATTHRPAADLGYLLAKHPDRWHESALPFGKAHLFYPVVSDARCEAVLILDVDPVGLVRGRGPAGGLEDQYVNDRPYAASSLLSVAMNKMLRSAMAGSSRDRQELADSALPLEARVVPLPARGGERLAHELFAPLGWSVDTMPVAGPDGSRSRYVDLRLSGYGKLAALLNQLYVLVPVLDDDKHYWVGDDEVRKLLDKGAGWLDAHPLKDLIVRRYLVHRRTLARSALARLAPEAAEEEADTEAPASRRGASEIALEAPIRLHDIRLDSVVSLLRDASVASVADLGCGEGKLLSRLVKEPWAKRIFGVDAAARDLDFAAKRLKMGVPGGPRDGRVTLLHGALTYRDRRWAEAEAAALVEVIEHLDPERLPALERVVFGDAKLKVIVVTTPNADYNVLFTNLAPGTLRHADHRFEWTREQFRGWAARIEERFGYVATFEDIGPVHETFGAPTQSVVFTR